MKFPKSQRLLTRRAYGRVKERSSQVKGKNLYIEYIIGQHHEPKLGICATKRFGKAVSRNRFKRCVREAFRQNSDSFPRGIEMIVKPRKYAAKAGFKEIKRELTTLFQG